MNILFFLTPKEDVAYIYDTYSPVSYTHLDTRFRFSIKRKFQENMMMHVLKENRKSFRDSSEFMEVFQNDPEILENLCSAELDLLNQVIFSVAGVLILARINFALTFFVLIPYAIGTSLLRKFGDVLSENQSKKRTVERCV